MEAIKLLNWIHLTDRTLQDKPKSILSLGLVKNPESGKYFLVDKSVKAKQELKLGSSYRFPPSSFGTFCSSTEKFSLFQFLCCQQTRAKLTGQNTACHYINGLHWIQWPPNAVIHFIIPKGKDKSFNLACLT